MGAVRAQKAAVLLPARQKQRMIHRNGPRGDEGLFFLLIA
jgi:hypothetical protein